MVGSTFDARRAGTRFLRSMLVGISATDSVTLVVFPLLLVAVELVAENIKYLQPGC